MADQELGNPISFLGELNALNADILLADQFHTFVTVRLIFIFGVTANVVQQTEVDQDLLILLRKVHAGMLTVDQCQE